MSDDAKTKTAKPTKPDNLVKRRYTLTADFKTKQGAVWPRGMQIDATEAEIRKRKIPAEPSDE